MKEGDSAPSSIISNDDHVSCSPRVKLKEGDACKTWNSSRPTHETKQVLEVTTVGEAATV